MAGNQFDAQQRIILEAATDVEGWYSWFVDQEYDICDGRTARSALERLLETYPYYGLSPDDLVEDLDAFQEGHVELIPWQAAACEDCRGSGQYVGFTVVEACRDCGGTGSRFPARIDVLKNAKTDGAFFRRLFESRCRVAVRTYRNTKQYLRQLAVGPDCVLCGIMLSGGDGLVLLRELSRRGFTSPVVVETIMEEFEDEALRRGAFAFLRYGHYELDDLVEVVQRAIASRPPISKVR